MDKMPLYPSMALGAGETTLLRLTNAYAMLDNGGHWLVPSVIDTVQDRHGKSSTRRGPRAARLLRLGRTAHRPGIPAAYIARSGRRTPSSISVSGAAWAENPIVYEPPSAARWPTRRPSHDIVAMMEAASSSAAPARRQPILKVSQAARRQDRHDERLFRRLVCRLFARFDGRHLCRLRRSAHARRWRDRRACRRRSSAISWRRAEGRAGQGFPGTRQGARDGQADNPGRCRRHGPGDETERVRGRSSGQEARNPARGAGWHGDRQAEPATTRSGPGAGGGGSGVRSAMERPAAAAGSGACEHSASGDGICAATASAGLCGGRTGISGSLGDRIRSAGRGRRLYWTRHAAAAASRRVRATRWRRTRRRPRPGASGPARFTAPAACTEGKSGIGRRCCRCASCSGSDMTPV